MRFDVFTLLPDVFPPYLESSILQRARQRGLIEVQVHNIRDWTHDRHHVTDDEPYAGGGGMVMKVEPVFEAVESVLGYDDCCPVILLTPQGRVFTQKVATELAAHPRLALICGRYEGVDERIRQHLATDEISIGDYVLTGGELPALTVIDAVSRKVKGVLGKEESLEEKRYGVGVPAYTRPETLTYGGKRYAVPKVLLSGHHGEIKRWRLGHKPRSEFLTGLRQNSILRNKMPVKNLLRGKKR